MPVMSRVTWSVPGVCGAASTIPATPISPKTDHAPIAIGHRTLRHGAEKTSDFPPFPGYLIARLGTAGDAGVKSRSGPLLHGIYRIFACPQSVAGRYGPSRR